MILSDSEILKEIEAGNIKITPFDLHSLGSNSYDVHLSKHLAIYDTSNEILDAKNECELIHFEMRNGSYVLQPNRLYLASTIEYTETHKHVLFLDGKSSSGRLGIQIHLTAGKGDVGFCGHWTLEIEVTQSVRVYEGMPIGQLFYHEVKGEVINPYNKKVNAKYNNADPRPQGSRMFMNFKQKSK